MNKNIVTLALLSSLTCSTTVLAHQAGDFLLRGGLTTVAPADNDNKIYLAGADSTMSIQGDNNTQLGLNFVYFYNNNWAVELLAATPFNHDVTITDKEDVLGVDGAKLAKITQLPPTLSALYYFDSENAFKPYVGVGLNYTIFFDEEFTDGPKSLGLSDLDLDNSFGLALQVGADYIIDKEWSINASVRYIDIDSDATFAVAGDKIGKATVEVDPMVYSLMLGYKF